MPDSFVAVRIARCFNIRLDKFYCGFTVSRLQSVFCSIFLYSNYFLGVYQCRMSALTASQTNVADFRCFFYTNKTFRIKRYPYSITKRRVPELMPVFGSQPAGDVSHKPGDRLPLLFARPAVTP